MIDMVHIIMSCLCEFLLLVWIEIKVVQLVDSKIKLNQTPSCINQKTRLITPGPAKATNRPTDRPGLLIGAITFSGVPSTPLLPSSCLYPLEQFKQENPHFVQGPRGRRFQPGVNSDSLHLAVYLYRQIERLRSDDSSRPINPFPRRG